MQKVNAVPKVLSSSTARSQNQHMPPRRSAACGSGKAHKPRSSETTNT